jgi:hypothetical protein
MSAALVVACGQEQSGRSGAAGGRQDRDSFGIAFRGSVLSIGYLALCPPGSAGLSAS